MTEYQGWFVIAILLQIAGFYATEFGISPLALMYFILSAASWVVGIYICYDESRHHKEMLRLFNLDKQEPKP